METVISLLVLGAIYLISYVMKSLSATQGEEGGKPILGEGFPTIEVLQPETETKATTPCVPKKTTVPAPHVEAENRTVTRLSQVDTKLQTLKKDETPVKHERLVALNSKSDAKRAFIYSEIFNRKY